MARSSFAVRHRDFGHIANPFTAEYTLAKEISERNVLLCEGYMLWMGGVFVLFMHMNMPLCWTFKLTFNNKFSAGAVVEDRNSHQSLFSLFTSHLFTSIIYMAHNCIYSSDNNIDRTCHAISILQRNYLFKAKIVSE